MSLNTPVCHRHKSCRDWLTKVFILPVSQRFIGYSVGQVKSTVGGARHDSRRYQPSEHLWRLYLAKHIHTAQIRLGKT